jgi:hypothetical protein
VHRVQYGPLNKIFCNYMESNSRKTVAFREESVVGQVEVNEGFTI